MTSRRLVPPAAGLAIAALAAAASPQAQTPPSFDATAHIVYVDVVVTDQQYRPVLDLTAADFEVFEDDARRDVVAFAAFGSAATKALAQPAPATGEPPAQFVRAATALVIDESHISPQQAARLGPSLTEVLRGLNERQGSLLVLAPLSDVAVAGRLPEQAAQLAQAAGRIRGRRFSQLSRFPLTDPEALEIERGDERTIKRVGARFLALNPELASQTDAVRAERGLFTHVESLAQMRATEVVDEARVRRGEAFGAVGQALAWLAGQPGRHSLLLLSAGFTHDPRDASFGRIVTESLRVNAAIHFLDVNSLAAFSTFETIEYGPALPPEARVAPFDTADAAAGAEELALTTGGLRVSGADMAEGMKRLLDTTRTYYVVGYEPVPKKKASFRKIRVRLKAGRGLRVLARRGYFDEGVTGRSTK